MHGKTSAVEHDGKGIFSSLPTPLTCTRYHSLIVEQKSLPAELAVTAHTHGSNGSGAAQRIRHHGPSASQPAHRGRAVPPRERAHRGRPPDDPQLPGHVTDERPTELVDALPVCARFAVRVRSSISRHHCAGGRYSVFLAIGGRRADTRIGAVNPAAAPTSAAARQPPAAIAAAAAASGAAPTFSLSSRRHCSAGQIHSRRGAFCRMGRCRRGTAAHTSPAAARSGRRSTAQVTLPYRGTMHVCASSSVKLAADSSARRRSAGEVPGLLIALDHGAVEMSFAASTAREQNADTLLTPYFRIMIGGPNAADVKVRLGDNGDTCVDNAGANAPYVVVTSVFEGGLYRVQPGQRVMFRAGQPADGRRPGKRTVRLPAASKSEANEFPLAQSEGLAPPSSPPAARRELKPQEAARRRRHSSTRAAKHRLKRRHDSAARRVACDATGPRTSARRKEKARILRRDWAFFQAHVWRGVDSVLSHGLSSSHGAGNAANDLTGPRHLKFVSCIARSNCPSWRPDRHKPSASRADTPAASSLR